MTDSVNQMVKCDACGNNISRSAEKCPSCGQVRSIYDRGFKPLMWLPIFILVIGLGICVSLLASGDDGWQLGLIMFLGGLFWLYWMGKKAGLK